MKKTTTGSHCTEKRQKHFLGEASSENTTQKEHEAMNPLQIHSKPAILVFFVPNFCSNVKLLKNIFKTKQESLLSFT